VRYSVIHTRSAQSYTLADRSSTSGFDLGLREYKPIRGCECLILPTSGLKTAMRTQNNRPSVVPGTHVSTSLRSFPVSIHRASRSDQPTNGLSAENREGAPSI
jgi:hypothetical protein